MIPLKDNIKSKNLPLVTISLIIINISVFIFQNSISLELSSFITHVFGFVPERISLSLTYYPGTYPFVTFVTSIFLHGNILHLGGNMLYLWIFGDNIEDVLGKISFLGFYLTVGVIGNLAHYLYDPFSQIPAIGASGAVAGVLGAYFIFFPHAKILTLVPLGFIITAVYLPAVLFLGIWILLQTVNALLTSPEATTSVAWWAHIGGFVAGMMVVFLRRLI